MPVCCHARHRPVVYVSFNPPMQCCQFGWSRCPLTLFIAEANIIRDEIAREALTGGRTDRVSTKKSTHRNVNHHCNHSREL